MERQHGLNNQQRSLFRGYPNMNGEFPVHMYKIILTSLVVLLCGCNKKVETGLTNPVVVSSIDSICALCEPMLNSPFEHIWLIYGDSIAKYCNSDELTELATKHNSLAVRYVAFKMLLKKDSHRAIKVVIDHIDDNDSITAFHLDEGFPRLLSGLRVGLVQGDRRIYNISVADSISIAESILKSNNRLKLYYYSSMQLRSEIYKNHGSRFN